MYCSVTFISRNKSNSRALHAIGYIPTGTAFQLQCPLPVLYVALSCKIVTLSSLCCRPAAAQIENP